MGKQSAMRMFVVQNDLDQLRNSMKVIMQFLVQLDVRLYIQEQRAWPMQDAEGSDLRITGFRKK